MTTADEKELALIDSDRLLSGWECVTSWKRTAPLYDVESAQGAGSAEGLLPRGGGGGLGETRVPQYKTSKIANKI